MLLLQKQIRYFNQRNRFFASQRVVHASTAATVKCQRHGTSYYFHSNPPTVEQLRYAWGFFRNTKPTFFDTAAKFRTIKESTTPEVAFFGRSNVGKSSLLNTLMGAQLCHTSSNPGRTKTMNFFAVGGEDGSGSPGRLLLVDMPGYGKGSHEEWGDEIMKYMSSSSQYVLTSAAVRPAFLIYR